MRVITTYEQFCQRVVECGFMTFTNNPWGAPSLEREVFGSVWGDELADPPWAWKNRIAEQQIALYGHALGGRNVFVSMAWVPVFFAANRPERDIEERYGDGLVDNLCIRVARELRALPVTTKFGLRNALNLHGKEGNRIEGAVLKLEREMFLSTGASTQKINKKGEPYGWHVNEIWLCEAFFDPQLGEAAQMERDDARERISEHILRCGGDPGAAKLFI
jgi:hypothetical protein